MRLVNGDMIAGVASVDHVWGEFQLTFKDKDRPPMRVPVAAIHQVWEA